MRAYNLQIKGEVYMIVNERGYELNIVQDIKDNKLICQGILHLLS